MISFPFLRAHLAAILLAAGLLVCTVAWHIPMMLWDQLDLVPLYEGWQNGSLVWTDLFRPRAGHVHGLAYLVLLATTKLSHGRPLLDCLASWALLCIFAFLVMRRLRLSLPAQSQSAQLPALLIVLFALFPGHLENLQWGWQVALFMSLVGTAVAIDFLACCSLSFINVSVALAAAAVAYLSFAIALALVPTAILLLLLRVDARPAQRVVCGSLWLLAGAAAYVTAMAFDAVDVPAAPPSLFDFVHYTLNLLGAPLCRFATDLAPWVGLLGILTAVFAFVRSVDRHAALPWAGFAAFGICSALLVAAARTATYGPAQAFVSRYVSISAVFWLGCIGLCALLPPAREKRTILLRRAALATVGILALCNAAQMTRKASRIAGETQAIAATIRATYPDVDPKLLRDIYFDQPDAARQRLAVLKSLDFPPFENHDAAGNRTTVK